MLQNISRELSTLLAARKIISIENIDAYAYGLELFFFKFIFYILVLILSLLSNTFFVSMLFVLIYLGLRQYSGGYHCKTSEMCMVVSLLIYLILICMYLFCIDEIAIVLEIFSILSCIVISIFAPVENKNKILDKTEKRKYHIISIVLSLILLIISTVTFFVNCFWIFYPSSYSLTATAIMILITLGRCKNNKGSFKSFSHRC